MDGVEAMIREFLLDREAAGAKRSTLANYRFALQRILVPWMRERGLIDLTEVDEPQLRELAVTVQRQQVQASTAWTYLRNIRLFLGWARSQGLEVETRLKLPRLDRRAWRVLERQEIQRLEESFQAERDRLIVRVLADTGMRPSELVSIRVGDVITQRREHQLLVRGKTGERLVPITPPLARRLASYAVHGRPESDFKQLFLSLRRDRHHQTHAPLTVSGVEQLLREQSRRVLGFVVTPYTFRRSAATWWLRSGMHPLLVAKLLGHRSTAMLDRHYAQLNMSDAARALMQILLSRDEP